MKFEAVIVRGLPWADHVNLQVDPIYRVTHDEGTTNLSIHPEFASAILPIREFARYELARDFLPIVEDADRRFLTVLQSHPNVLFGLVKFGWRLCPDCRGSGEYRGLLVIELCSACAGAGRTAILPKREEIEAAERLMIEVFHPEEK